MTDACGQETDPSESRNEPMFLLRTVSDVFGGDRAAVGWGSWGRDVDRGYRGIDNARGGEAGLGTCPNASVKLACGLVGEERMKPKSLRRLGRKLGAWSFFIFFRLSRLHPSFLTSLSLSLAGIWTLSCVQEYFLSLKRTSYRSPPSLKTWGGAASVTLPNDLKKPDITGAIFTRSAAEPSEREPVTLLDRKSGAASEVFIIPNFFMFT